MKCGKQYNKKISCLLKTTTLYRARPTNTCSSRQFFTFLVSFFKSNAIHSLFISVLFFPPFYFLHFYAAFLQGFYFIFKIDVFFILFPLFIKSRTRFIIASRLKIEMFTLLWQLVLILCLISGSH